MTLWFTPEKRTCLLLIVWFRVISEREDQPEQLHPRDQTFGCLHSRAGKTLSFVELFQFNQIKQELYFYFFSLLNFYLKWKQKNKKWFLKIGYLLNKITIGFCLLFFISQEFVHIFSGINFLAGECYFCIFVNFVNQKETLYGSMLSRAEISAILASLRSLQRPCSILTASICQLVILVRFMDLAVIRLIMALLFNLNPFLRPRLAFTGSVINKKLSKT